MEYVSKVRFVLALLLSLPCPGAGHLIYLRWIGLLWLFGTLLGYVCLVVPGLLLHIACLVHFVRMDKSPAQVESPFQKPMACGMVILVLLALTLFLQAPSRAPELVGRALVVCLAPAFLVGIIALGRKKPWSWPAAIGLYMMFALLLGSLASR